MQYILRIFLSGGTLTSLFFWISNKNQLSRGHNLAEIKCSITKGAVKLPEN